MRVVAIGAGISFPETLFQIPVTRHAAMTSILIVAVLRAVTLGTKLHALGKIQRLSVSFLQSVVIIRIVTTQAGLRSMLVEQALVEFIERFALVRLEIRLPRIVAGGAGHHHRLAFRVLFPGVHQRHTAGFSNDHQMGEVAGLFLGKRPSWPVPRALQPRDRQCRGEPERDHRDHPEKHPPPKSVPCGHDSLSFHEADDCHFPWQMYEFQFNRIQEKIFLFS